MKKCILFFLLLSTMFFFVSCKSSVQNGSSPPAHAQSIPTSSIQDTSKATQTTAPTSQYIPLVCGACCAVPFDFQLWTGTPYNDLSRPDTCTVSFEGQSYSGEYRSISLYSFAEYYPRHRYRAQGLADFWVDSSGKLLAFSANISKYVPGPAKTESECIEIARSIARNLLNIDQYQMETIYSRPEAGALYNQYRVIFTRPIDGLKTAEKLVLSIAEDGTLLSFQSTMLGRFDTVSIPSVPIDILENEVMKALEAQALTYSRKYDSYSCILEDSYLTMVSENEYAMIYETMIYFYTEVDGETLCSDHELIQYVILL